jgi:hypothetical protein
MLISETHFTKKSYIRTPNYSIYDTQHPDGTAHGGTAILIRNDIRHHLHRHYNLEHLQATSITIEACIGPLTIAEVYCPSKHASSLLLANAFWQEGIITHQWGSQLITPKGRKIFKAMQMDNLTRFNRRTNLLA